MTPPGSADAVRLAQRLVQTPSVNPNLEAGGQGEARVAELAAEWLAGWGYQTETHEVAPGRHNIVARRGPVGGRILAFNGHLDTVGVSGMTDPFSGAVREGRLHGRGACDMKGGIGAALAAAAVLSQEDLGGELVIALTADEEHASIGMQALVDSGFRADACVVCEPTSLQIMPAHKGFLWSTVRVHGRAAHGSRPDVGVDAITHMGHVLRELEVEGRRLAGRPGHPLLGVPSIHAATIEGGSAPSVYPEACELVIERRTLPGETEDDLRAEVEALVARARSTLPGLDAAVDPGLYRAGTELGAEHPLVSALEAACHRNGVAGVTTGMSAWVDACFLNQAGIAALCFGPGSIARAHAQDEWAPVAEIETCANVLIDLARRLLDPRVPPGA